MDRPIPAIDVATSEVDDDIGSVDFPRPFSQNSAIPEFETPRNGNRAAAQHDHFIAADMK